MPEFPIDFSRRVFLGFWVAPMAGFVADPLPRNVVLYGKEEPLPTAIALRAGPVTAIFEPELAILRYVKYGDGEILRGLYAAVRDKVWGTVTPVVSNVVTEQRADSFRVTFDVTCRQDDIDFAWKGTITGEASGAVRFEFAGRARSTFLKNRLGFAVLHPIKECAGKLCRIEHASGAKQEGRFPDEISPNQPFFDLRAISHEVAPGVWAEVRMEGDVFEMEDHRNWTDNNYKTYCTPLGNPYPVEVARGQEIRQSVSIRVSGGGAVSRVSRSREVTIEAAGARAIPAPAIGTAVAMDSPTLTSSEQARLRAAGLKHLRADLRLYDASWQETWKRVSAEAAAMGAGIEAAVFVSDAADDELKALAARRGSARIARWIVFHRDENSTREKWVEIARKHLMGAPLGAGTNVFFTELNRERPPMAAIDFTCYSVNPQVHAFDNASLVENLEGQAATVSSARRFAGIKPVCVTPVTLKQRYNPQAKGQPEVTPAGRLPSRIDPRQMSLFGAAWTLGSLKYLAETGAASVTYYETHGWAGLMESATGSRVPALFRSMPGGVFPLYHVLADFAEFGGASVQPTITSDLLRACGLLLTTPRQRRLLVANLTADEQVVSVAGSLLGARARVRVLDEHNFAEASRDAAGFRRSTGAMMEPLNGRYRIALGAYAVARLDG